MSHRQVAGAWLACSLLVATLLAAAQAGGPGKLTLSSADIPAGGRIGEAQVFSGFGCKGGNLSPALTWSGEPEGTRSFALLVHDPDAPTGSGWWHWILYNIPAGTHSLAAGAGDARKGLLPAGSVQGRSDFGTPGYGGPCPPPGAPHHYHFVLYALKVAKLDLPADATAAFVAFNVKPQALAEADLTGLYGR
jgi:Raf kinase inhibitor-like YbhB/YbcL family protein